MACALGGVLLAVGGCTAANIHDVDAPVQAGTGGNSTTGAGGDAGTVDSGPDTATDKTPGDAGDGSMDRSGSGGGSGNDGGVGGGGAGTGGGAGRAGSGGVGVGGSSDGGIGTGGALIGTGGVGSGGIAGGTGGLLDGGADPDASDAGGTGGDDGGGSDVPIVPAPNAGELVISEIMVDSDAVSDDFGEWLEIYNPSATQTYDLYSCTISDLSHVDSITRHLQVAPGAFVTLARFADISGGFVPDFAYVNVKFGNPPAGDAATLKCGTTIIDRVDFQGGTGFVITKGRSLSLSPMHYNAVDNDVAANWCSGKTIYHTVGNTNDYGSPEMPNPTCP